MLELPLTNLTNLTNLYIGILIKFPLPCSPPGIIIAEFKRGGELQSLLLRYTQALFTQVTQTATCNRLHTIEERLARWLLIVADRMQSNTFPLTQEFIAQMLGCRRAGVTVAPGILSRAGIISYKRGKIIILNREDLEQTSCECYSIVKNEYARLLGTPK